jgi:Uma2 family endonuclease
MYAERTRLTYDDYVLIPDDGKRHEIIDGEEYVSPSPNTRHQRLVTRLGRELSGHVESRRLGEAFVAPYDIVLSDYDVVQPDIVFISKQRLNLITDANLQGAPDLIVEILSDSTRRHDFIRKRHLYERAGVAEYWVVDPEIDQVQVFRLEGEAYVRAAELTAENEDVLASPLLPGLEISLKDLFG